MGKKILVSILLLIGCVITVKAQIQQVTSASGGYLEGNQVSVSYTVGESVSKTLEGSTFYLTQGFQQPNIVITTVSEVEGFKVTVQAFPNPVSSFLKIVTGGDLPGQTSYQLYNLAGSCIDDKKLHGTETEIDFQTMVSSTYLLKIISGSQVIKTFKIVKR